MESNNTTADIEKLEWDYFIHERLAATIILAILSVVGTTGNIHVLVVYSRLKRSKLRLFILVLAVNDIFGSSVTIPLSITDIRYSMTWKSSVYCKLIRFVTYQATMTSGLLLGVVAFERYRKVCYPFGSQMTFRQMKIGCVVPIVVSTILAAPTLYLYGSVRTDIKLHPEMSIGKMCGPHETHQTIPYFSCLLIIGTCVVILEIFFYVSITISIIRWKAYKRYLLNHNKDGDDKTENTPLLDKDHERKYKRYQNSRLMNDLGQDDEYKRKEMEKMDTAARLSIMFMLTAIFTYAGYIPIITNSLVQAANSKAFTDLAEFLGPSITLLNRLYFLNNIVNPIMYGLMDKKFRQTCKDMYGSFC